MLGPSWGTRAALELLGELSEGCVGSGRRTRGCRCRPDCSFSGGARPRQAAGSQEAGAPASQRGREGFTAPADSPSSVVFIGVCFIDLKRGLPFALGERMLVMAVVLFSLL